jgi:hypothetical protein
MAKIGHKSATCITDPHGKVLCTAGCSVTYRCVHDTAYRVACVPQQSTPEAAP